jgi:hypothetical protein
MDDQAIEGLLNRLDERTKRMDRYLTERLERTEAALPVLHQRIDKNRDAIDTLKDSDRFQAGVRDGEDSERRSGESLRRWGLSTVLSVIGIVAAIVLGIIGLFR